MNDDPDTHSLNLFPLTDKQVFAKRAERQIQAAWHHYERSFDTTTAEQWLTIGKIFNHLKWDWKLCR